MSRHGRRREEEIRRARRIFAVSMAIAIALIAFIVIYIFINPPTPYYNGRYSSILREVLKKFQNDPRWSNKSIYLPVLHEIFYEYYLKLYNTSFIMNKTFEIARDRSIIYRVFLAANETLYVETRGNGTYYYILSLDEQGYIRLLNEALPGNSTREIRVSNVLYLKISNETRKVIIYNETYLILLTNSTKPVRGYIFINKTPPLNLSSILDVYPVEYTVWLFQNWVKDRYNIIETNLETLENTRPPWEIIRDDIGEITSFEACLLLYKLYNITGIETRVIAIDIDGDNELDNFALALKYDKSPEAFGKAIIDYILEDANIHVNMREISIKHAVTYDATWIILDPLYEEKYIPGSITNIQFYEYIGIII